MHARNSVLSKNVHWVALNLIELVNSRRCARARATKRHRRSYVQNPSCNKVLWFQSGRAANAAFVPAAVALTVRESGRRTTCDMAKTSVNDRRVCDTLYLSARRLYYMRTAPCVYRSLRACDFTTILSRQLKFCEWAARARQCRALNNK